MAYARIALYKPLTVYDGIVSPYTRTPGETAGDGWLSVVERERMVVLHK